MHSVAVALLLLSLPAIAQDKAPLHYCPSRLLLNPADSRPWVKQVSASRVHDLFSKYAKSRDSSFSAIRSYESQCAAFSENPNSPTLLSEHNRLLNAATHSLDQLKEDSKKFVDAVKKTITAVEKNPVRPSEDQDIASGAWYWTFCKNDLNEYAGRAQGAVKFHGDNLAGAAKKCGGLPASK